MALSGGGDGAFLQPDYRLVDEDHLGQGDCAGRLTDGGMGTLAEAGRQDLLGSRVAVQQ